MSIADIAVLVGSVLAIAGPGWFFFAPRKAHTAQITVGVQRVEVTVPPCPRTSARRCG